MRNGNRWKPDLRRKRLYNTTLWRKIRLRWLDDNPLCVMCQDKGIVEPAVVVDHIQPHKGDERLFWDERNLQSLCFRCHDTVKRREERGKYRRIILEDGMPLDWE